jgi:Ras-related protein Rab-1A
LSLSLRSVENKFDKLNSQTIGVDFRAQAYESRDKRQFVVQLWDTAGQERFQSIVQAYFRCAHGVILVYDVSNEESIRGMWKYLQTYFRSCATTEKIPILVSKECITLLFERKQEITRIDLFVSVNFFFKGRGHEN